MTQIQCTNALRKQLPALVDVLAVDGAKLHNWSAKLIDDQRPAVVVALNEETSAAAIAFLDPPETLRERLAQSVAIELRRHGVGEDAIRLEVEALSKAEYAKNTNRSLMGSLNEAVHYVRARLEDLENASHGDLLDILVGLNRWCHTGNRAFTYADEGIATIFGVPRIERTRKAETRLEVFLRFSDDIWELDELLPDHFRIARMAWNATDRVADMPPFFQDDIIEKLDGKMTLDTYDDAVSVRRNGFKQHKWFIEAMEFGDDGVLIQTVDPVTPPSFR